MKRLQCFGHSSAKIDNVNIAQFSVFLTILLSETKGKYALFAIKIKNGQKAKWSRNIFYKSEKKRVIDNSEPINENTVNLEWKSVGAGVFDV